MLLQRDVLLWMGEVKVRPKVWTKLKAKGRANKRKNRTEEGERPRSRSRPASSLSDRKVDGGQIEQKASKPLAAFGKIAQQEILKGTPELEQQMNQQVHEQTTMLRNLESLITENHKRTAAEDRSCSNGSWRKLQEDARGK